MAAMLFFKMSIIIFHKHVFTAINILCKFDEDIFITERDIKLDFKNAHMHDQTRARMEGVSYLPTREMQKSVHWF